MGNFQVIDALSFLFKLEKLPVEHLNGFILLLREGGELQNFLELLMGNSSSRTQKNSPTGVAKASASMVGGIFTIATMSC